MEREFKYVTVLDYGNGQVYLYDYDETKMPNAANFVSLRHDLDNVNYMVHKYRPALWTKDVYYCTKEQAYRLIQQKVDLEELDL